MLYNKSIVLICVLILVTTTGIKAQTGTTHEDPFIINFNATPVAGTGYTFTTTALTFQAGANGLHYRINGASTPTNIARRIVVEAGITVNITIHNVRIAGAVQNPLSIAPGSTVNLTISEDNRLTTTTAGKAGIYVPDGATLTITGACSVCRNPIPWIKGNCENQDPCDSLCVGEIPGTTRGCTHSPPCSLTVTGSNGGGAGAGIGGNGVLGVGETRNSGNITINSGNITATGGNGTGNREGSGAGIGGGGGGTTNRGGDVMGNIVFNGGKVIATGGTAPQNSGAGAGIGGGGAGANDGGNIFGVIYIYEGEINAYGGAGTNPNSGAAAGIGGGGGGANGNGGGSNDGWIVIEGGKIIAYGGADQQGAGGAGIGGGGGAGSSGVNAGGNGGGINLDENTCIDAKGGGSAPGVGSGGPENVAAGAISITGPISSIAVEFGNITEILIARAGAVVGTGVNAIIELRYRWSYYNILTPSTIVTTAMTSAGTVTPSAQRLNLELPIPPTLPVGEYRFYCYVESYNTAPTPIRLDSITSGESYVYVVVMNYGIDYEREKLTGLAANTVYAILANGLTLSVTSDTNGEIDIQENWIGRTIEIGGQQLTIPARPATPTGIGSTPETLCDDVPSCPGTITGVSNEMEYKKSNVLVWTRVNTEPTVANVTAGDYQVRIAADNTLKRFASLPRPIIVDINVMPMPETGTIYHIYNNL